MEAPSRNLHVAIDADAAGSWSRGERRREVAVKGSRVVSAGVVFQHLGVGRVVELGRLLVPRINSAHTRNE
jgi:hypothetical protein